MKAGEGKPTPGWLFVIGEQPILDQPEMCHQIQRETKGKGATSFSRSLSDRTDLSSAVILG